MNIALLLIGLICGTVTGLISVGGGIILIFFLVVFFPLISDSHFSMQTIAGFSIMLTFFSTLSGGVYYVRNKLVDNSLVLLIGIPAFIGGGIGSYLAGFTSESLLKSIFALTAVISAILMLIPVNLKKDSESFSFTTTTITLSILIGTVIGLLGGLVGLGAGFLFVPLLIIVYKVPIKKAIGSSLIICFMLAFGSFIIKLSLGDIPLGHGIILTTGGIIGAQIGGRIAKQLDSFMIKRIAAYSILAVSLKLIFDLIVI